MNSRLNILNPYPFEKLAKLFAGVTPPANFAPINISIGEPKHPVAPFLREAMANALDGISIYPTTKGQLPLRQAAASWCEKRFNLPTGAVDPEKNLLPVNGTREALYSFAQAVLDESSPGLVVMPNPFYQIYEGAALMYGGTPYLVSATAKTGFLPDYENLPEEVLQKTRLMYICTPSNPTGAVFSRERLMGLIELAHKYDFVIASDECYSEIWYDLPPSGLLEAAWQAGHKDFSRCVIFHSLSKRSNMPGARSGFVAGDGEILKKYLHLRTYTGCATPPFVQDVATLAWSDESHVEANRVLYRQKLAEAEEILSPVLPVERPQAGFYLWLRVPGGGEAFAKRLLEQFNVTVLPGGYLGRPTPTGNPGDPFIRVAMVASLEENREAMKRIARLANLFDCGCS
ncbi:MAG: succinyldiaminopimelate transaminase [Magnetococcales bacterium]|nr:succinyldiaminopimelate transaminase [Magnetococcales bacterium]NGZ26876.1 succinyldiaminopimelate transaminase [Magnetococcales bacterium]